MDLRAATRALHPVGGRPCVGEFDLLAAAKRARLHNFAVKNNVDQFAVASFYRLHLSLLPALRRARSEEHTSELQSLMRISYAVFCLKQKTTNSRTTQHHSTLAHSSTYQQQADKK